MPVEGREQNQPSAVDVLKETVGRFLGIGTFSDIEVSPLYDGLSGREKDELRAHAKTVGLPMDSEKAGKKKSKEKRQKTKRGEAPPADLVGDAPDASEDSELVEDEPVVPPPPTPVVKTPAPDTTPTPSPEKPPVSPEKKETKPDWEFTGYTAKVVEEPRDGKRGPRSRVEFTCHITQHDGNKDIPNDYDANFGFTPETYRWLKADPELLKRAASELSEMRREIDVEQVKVMLDPRKDKPGEFVPKWVYRFGGKRQNEPFSLNPDRGEEDERPFYERMPANVVDLIKKNPKDYYKMPEYLKWYHPAMASKREQVIGEAWEARLNAPSEAEAEPAPVVVAKPAEPVMAGGVWSKFGGPERLAGLEDMRRGVRDIVRSLGGIVSNSKDADERLETVVQFAMAGLRDQAAIAGGKLPDDYEAVVRETARRELHGMVAGTDPERRVNLMTEPEDAFARLHPSLGEAIGGGRLNISRRLDGEKARWVALGRLEEGREAEGQQRFIRAVVAESLTKVTLDDHRGAQSTPTTQAQRRSEVEAQLTKVLNDYISGPRRDTRQGSQFRSSILDVEGSRVIVRDYDELSRMIVRLAAFLQ